MALKEVCDVFGTAKAVKKYQIMVRPLDDDLKPLLPVLEKVVAWGPRALERAEKFIERSCSPPSKGENGDTK